MIKLHPGRLTVLIAALASLAGADESTRLSPSATPRLDAVEMPAAEEIQQAIHRGVDFLLHDQNPNGSWGTAQRTKNLNIYAPVPGAHHAFRTAVTSLCICALCEVGSDRQEVQASLDRAEQWLLENLPSLRRATGDAIYNVWGHGYSIKALVRLHQRSEDPARQARYVELIRSQFDLLERYASVDGGWGYYDQRIRAKQPTTSSMSFVNATVLIALKEAQELGVEPPERLVDRAVEALRRQRKPDFTYLYGEYLKDRPMRGINRPAGSLGRSQACNLALRLWGDELVTDDILKTWLHRLFARNGWLDMGRKRPIPHESWFQVAGYFFYYGHYYAGLCIADLPAAARPEFQAHMARLMLRLQETDGSWWDFPLYNYHQQYGTAYALMTLHRCR
jgi:hypothetical protein